MFLIVYLVYRYLHVCMHACMYVRTYACMHVHMHVCTYVRMYVCMYNFILTNSLYVHILIRG
jgi:hypothetical protein